MMLSRLVKQRSLPPVSPTVILQSDRKADDALVSRIVILGIPDVYTVRDVDPNRSRMDATETDVYFVAIRFQAGVTVVGKESQRLLSMLNAL